jgi:signal transduction histidine kinase
MVLRSRPSSRTIGLLQGIEIGGCFSLSSKDSSRLGSAAGQGLTNLEDRAAAMGGKESVTTDPGEGTTVRVELRQ